MQSVFRNLRMLVSMIKHQEYIKFRGQSCFELIHVCKIAKLCYSKSSRLPQERIELIQKLAKESDIYERLARAIGKLNTHSFIRTCRRRNSNIGGY